MIKNSYILIVDTSFKGASLAIVEGTTEAYTILAQAQYFSNQIAAARLPRALRQLMDECTIEFSHLSSILINNGPGSFTGIKVGLAFIGGIKEGCPNIDVIGLSGLECLAWLYPNKDWFLPATKTQGYFARTEGGNGKVYAVDISEGSVNLVSENEPNSILYQPDSSKTIEILQPWPALERELLENRDPYSINGLGVYSAMIIDGMMRHHVKYGKLDNDRPVPLPRYIRKSAPEEALAKKSRKS